jgi:hypothetical protein
MSEWDEVDWVDLTPRLLAYAAFELSKYKMDVGSDIPKEYVERAVVRVLDGHGPTFYRSMFARIAVVIHDEIGRDHEGRRR